MKTNVEQMHKIIDSCRGDANEQLDMVRSLIENTDGKDIQALAIVALAAENCGKTIKRFCLLNLRMRADGVGKFAA